MNETNTTTAAVKAADVEAFLLSQAQLLSDQFPKENIYVACGASRWPFATPASEPQWLLWNVSIGTAPCRTSQNLAEAIRLASEAYSPAGQIQAKLDAIEKLHAEIAELAEKREGIA